MKTFRIQIKKEVNRQLSILAKKRKQWKPTKKEKQTTKELSIRYWN